MTSDRDSDWFERLKARIDEYNQKDLQAIARGREERDKLLQAKDEDHEQASLKT